ncbi:phosphate ABC transporter permease subunit PstC [Nocardioides rubriscoriae]|uniref:phosphate ABC transporter permease subunit PstC n=1 Tax=Nocardioides rubriscoriae TaxID=642762 RepID=UPI0011DF9E0B|nr:phosphate ABC transporter permease subunit PstC [Nocardioides rubriscoriae]
MTTTLSDLDRPQPDGADITARAISRRNTGADAVFAHATRAIGTSVLVVTGGVGLFLGYQAIPTFKRYGLSFFTEQQWSPDTDTIGIAAVLVGTFQVALVAMVIAFPLALATALYISEYAPARLKPTLVSMVDLMAAVPSVIYGLFVALLIMPYAADLSIWFDRNLGWLPIFEVPGGQADAPIPALSQYFFSAFVAGIAVSMMVLPMACAVMRQVFSQTPPGEKEAALALGASTWGMIRTVVLPFGRGGIIGGTMLALGRALGETIAVALIISPSFEIKWSLTEQGGSTISSLIANRFGTASPSQLSALLAAGLVLFLITLVINTLAATVVNRSRSGAETD